MPIPDFQTLMKPVLSLYQDGQEHKTVDIVEELADDFGLTDEERNRKFPSGKNKVFKNRVGWAVAYLRKAVLIKRLRKGVSDITERGKEVLGQEPEKIDNNFLLQYSEFAEFLRPNRQREVQPVTQEESSLTPEEQLNKSYEEINSSIRLELLDRILSQTPEFFEELVIKLLQAMGYGDEQSLAKAIGGTGDGGIDGVVHQDKLGLDVVYIQAKRYDKKNSVGRPSLQKFVGSLTGESATKGVFVTTSSFSSQAIEYLNTVQQRVVTIDGNRLVELMIQHGVGVRAEQTYTINRIDEDFFSD